MKKAFPVSIDEDLAEWIISNANKKFRNRSHLVEEAVREFKEKCMGEEES